MREFGKIKTTVWASKKFKQVSIPLSKVLYLYLHCNTHGNSIGCYYVTKGYMLGDIRLSEVSIEAIDRAINELSDLGLIKWDDDEEIVYLIDFLKHSPLTNRKHAMGAAKAASILPDIDLKAQVYDDIIAAAGTVTDKVKSPSVVDQVKQILGRAPIEVLEPSDTPIDTGTYTTETKTQTQTQTETEIETESPSSPPEGESGLEDLFELFWKAYPFVSGNPKEKARGEFVEAVARRGGSAQHIIDAASAYHKSLPESGPPKPCHAWKFLKERRYKDEFCDQPETTKAEKYRRTTPEESAAWLDVTGYPRNSVADKHPWPMVKVDGVDVPYPDAMTARAQMAQPKSALVIDLGAAGETSTATDDLEIPNFLGRNVV